MCKQVAKFVTVCFVLHSTEPIICSVSVAVFSKVQKCKGCRPATRMSRNPTCRPLTVIHALDTELVIAHHGLATCLDVLLFSLPSVNTT